MKLAKNVAFQDFSTVSASGGKFALSGGKSRLSGGWAHHSRPVWAEHCILTALVKACCLVVVDGPCDGCLSVSYVCMYTHYNNYYFLAVT